MSRARKEAASPEASLVASISRLALQPGDTLVVTLARELTAASVVDALREYIAPHVPAGAKLLIVDDRVQFSILGPA